MRQAPADNYLALPVFEVQRVGLFHIHAPIMRTIARAIGRAIRAQVSRMREIMV